MLASFEADPTILTQTTPIDPYAMQALSVIEDALRQTGIVPEDTIIINPEDELDTQLMALIDAVPLE